jgi:mRNA-degrading endonuclease RelE of RelBE toxin-antitoxin system
MTQGCVMIFIETSVFTRHLEKLMSDDEYRLLQKELVKNPDKGVLLRNSGGLRKLRWAAEGRGKRGGLRLIYYWAVTEHQIFMLHIYPKTKQEDLAPAQLRELRRIIEER